MISYIKGELSEVSTEGIIVEAAGIGYEIKVPASLLSRLPSLGSLVKIHTYLQVKEDGASLFGFLDREDLEVFRLLLTVNGIGPKGALGILSVLSPDDLRFAVLGDDIKTLSRAPGLGKKTAQKVILELKDKFHLEEAFEKRLSREEAPVGTAPDAKGEAVQALVALGYSSSEALQAVRGLVDADSMSVEEILKQALKRMSL
ncbi:Holliday junction branch migration protein RuvA [Hominifimenecus sp. rT4P-3]|uniref:Holliday junction branch migration protein RuvA n=1 Tax=Hominifimenecus sp. rT4P-3 TaxID=3242979 RepID=UPI003DA57F31